MSPGRLVFRAALRAKPLRAMLMLVLVALPATGADPQDARDTARLEGRVVDALDNGIEGATVEVWRDALPLPQDPLSRTTSDARGSFRLEIDPGGPYLMRVHHRDYAPTPNRIGLFVPESGLSLGLLALQTGLVMRGRVVDEQNQPLGDIEVFVRTSSWSVREEHGHALQRTRTEDDGNFTFVGLAARRHTLHVRADATWSDRAIAGVRARLPDEDPLVVRLTRGHPLRGRLLDFEKRGLGGSRIFARCESTPTARPHEIETAADGSFAVERLQAGRWRLHADRDGLATSTVVTLPRREQLILTLPAPRSASVRLKSRGDLPDRVRWRLTWPDRRHSPRSGWRSAAVRNGIVTLEGLPGPRGPFDVELRVTAHARAFLTSARLRRPSTLDLAPASRIELTVEAPDAGRLDVRGVRLDGPGFEQTLRLASRLAVGELPAGSYRLSFDGRTLLRTTLAAGERQRQSLRWPPPSGGLRVEIGPESRVGTEVHVYEIDRKSARGFRDIRRSPASGKLSFSGLAPGRYGVRLRLGSGKAKSELPRKIVEVSANRTVEVRLP